MKYAFLLLLAVPNSTVAYAGVDRQTEEIFHNYTDCVVRQNPKEAAQVVLSTDPTYVVRKSHPNLITRVCLDASWLSFPGGDFIRYGLAEALVKREFANGLPNDIRQAGAVPHFELNESDYHPRPGKTEPAEYLARLEKRKLSDTAIRTLSIYGECVVRADPAASLRLVLSSPGSAAETAAVSAMNSELSSCLPKGQTIKLDKMALRGTVAMNLYRIAHAPRTQAATQPN